nr:hypothetical protein [Tanacetum cinerariifolium]
MAASTIIISSDSSNESVGSPPSWVILFGDIPIVIPSTSVIALETSATAPVISSVALVVKTTIVASPTGLCGLDSDPSEASDSFEAPPSQDPYVTTVAHWRSRVTTCSSSPSDFPIALVTAPPKTRQRAAILIRPEEAIPLVRPYSTRPNAPRRVMTIRKRVGPLPAQSSSGDSSERPLHLSSHSVRPSRKRCRSLTDYVPSSTSVMGSLAPTRANFLLPRKRFRDSYSPETSMEEDTKIDTIETEDGRELDIVEWDNVRDHSEVDPRDDRE